MKKENFGRRPPGKWAALSLWLLSWHSGQLFNWLPPKLGKLSFTATYVVRDDQRRGAAASLRAFLAVDAYLAVQHTLVLKYPRPVSFQ